MGGQEHVTFKFLSVLSGQQFYQGCYPLCETVKNICNGELCTKFRTDARDYACANNCEFTGLEEEIMMLYEDTIIKRDIYNGNSCCDTQLSQLGFFTAGSEYNVYVAPRCFAINKFILRIVGIDRRTIEQHYLEPHCASRFLLDNFRDCERSFAYDKSAFINVAHDGFEQWSSNISSAVIDYWSPDECAPKAPFGEYRRYITIGDAGWTTRAHELTHIAQSGKVSISDLMAMHLWDVAYNFNEMLIEYHCKSEEMERAYNMIAGFFRVVN
ncbi:hypothetical protein YASMINEVIRUS_83 [Yasminevirus sp. GU-2018]|uniref:Uncharacterized protein n=1 Tax=Yasminevirus sp. GU-2018 TaxID=2420051 RepID=A0A5K0U735_9VIRU|nr:hypothetical protein YASMINEVIRUS_83 [Yasminevirus sp. GU-2018]